MKNIKERMKTFYNESEKYLSVLSNLNHYRRDDVLAEYVSFVIKNGPENGIYLDLGCGTGETSIRLARAGKQVTGVDISSKLLSVSAHKNIQNLSFVVSDISTMPFPDNFADCIALNDVIEHIPDVESLLKEFVRVVKKDGTIIILSPNLLTPIKPIRHFFGVEGFNVKFYGSRLKTAAAFFRNIYLSVTKTLTPRPSFVYREPLLEEFQCPDDDAVYLSNFMDLKNWFSRNGWNVTYSPLKEGAGFLGGIKSRILNRFPWLDKGFCLTTRKRIRP